MRLFNVGTSFVELQISRLYSNASRMSHMEADREISHRTLSKQL